MKVSNCVCPVCPPLHPTLSQGEEGLPLAAPPAAAASGALQDKSACGTVCVCMRHASVTVTTNVAMCVCVRVNESVV